MSNANSYSEYNDEADQVPVLVDARFNFDPSRLVDAGCLCKVALFLSFHGLNRS